MAVSGISVVVVWTKRLAEMFEFYASLGLRLEKEDHGEGPIHYACEVGKTHFAIYEGNDGQAVDRGNGGCSQIGFHVADVDAIFAVAKKFGTRVIWEPRDMPWGRAALICDPDGRPIELNQAPTNL